MSLVNDMLRDLSNRRDQPDQKRSIRRVMDREPPPAQSQWPILVLVIAIAVVAGGLIGFYLSGGSDNASDFMLASTAGNQDEVINASKQGDDVNELRITEHNTEHNTDLSTSEVVDTAIDEQGLSVSFEFQKPAVYEIVSRSEYGVEILFRNVEQIVAGQRVSGMSLIQEQEGVLAIIELNNEVDFLINNAQENENRVDINLIYKEAVNNAVSEGDNDPALEKPVTEIREKSASSTFVEQVSQREPDTGRPAVTTPINIEDKATASEQNNNSFVAPVRTSRELSLDARDSNNVQSAMQDFQKGNILQAYEKLYSFINENPQGHQSRETLATLLLAQGDIVQANIITEQGLIIAPNYSAYKKLKARILMSGNEFPAAISLLRNVPPEISADPEYFELLASLYQKSGNHQDAISTYQSLIRSNSQQARWWVGMGLSHEAKGRYSEAVSSYKAALRLPELDSSLRQYSQNRINNLEALQ